MLRGSHANAGVFPGQIAEQLRGRSFDSFADFRQEFWRAVGADSLLVAGFRPQSIARMRSGHAPFVAPEQRFGGGLTLVLHHVQPIQHGGGVYDMGNLILLHPDIIHKYSTLRITMGMVSMHLDEQARLRCFQLIRQLRDPALPDEDIGTLLAELERLLVNPHVSEILFFGDPEISDEEVINRALEYRPFAL